MQLLIEALRSGKYQQNFGTMRSGNSYCCLGLACEIYRQIHPDEYQWHLHDGRFTFVDYYMPAYTYSGQMPLKVAHFFGLGNAIGKFEVPPEYQVPSGYATLTHLNDGLKWSFKSIGGFLKTKPTFIEVKETTWLN